MGVIAPEKKTKTSRLPLVVFLLFFIVVPVLFISIGTSQNHNLHDAVEKKEQTSGITETSAVTDEASSGNTSVEEETAVKTEKVSESAVKTDNVSGSLIDGLMNVVDSKGNNIASGENVSSSLYSENQTYSKDADGLYVLKGPVMDTAHVLTEQQFNTLTNFLLNFSDQTGAQIAVLVVQNMDGEDIENFSWKHAEKWQLGQKGVDNGALLTVAMDEHDVRIETGYGTEGTLTDLLCGRIIRNVIIPQFKNGNYGEGILEGVQKMAGVMAGNEELTSGLKASKEDGGEDKAGMVFFFIFFFFFWLCPLIMSIIATVAPNSAVGKWIRKFFGSSTGTRLNNRGVYYHGGYGGSFGGGGGHSFGGGGGSFGGGGSSGHW